MADVSVVICDSTLRDGMQGEGIAYSVKDKLRLVGIMDEIGVTYIEAGNPAAYQKDAELFEHLKHAPRLRNSKLCVFGRTRRKDLRVSDDKQMNLLRRIQADAVTIVGKSHVRHVTDILTTSLDENLAMINETIGYLKGCFAEVFYDAEHFFDGFKNNAEYAIKTLQAAKDAGANGLVLCDTNGGSLYEEIFEIVKHVKRIFPDSQIGIHTHNDMGMAVANTMAAVHAGARHVQGTMLGFGERCGNASLASLIPTLQFKLGYRCIPDDSLGQLTEQCTRIAEISNLRISKNTPYIGRSAFAHKAGMHMDAVFKSADSFEHISPEAVGNERRFLLSEMSGRTAILTRIQSIAPHLDKNSAEVIEIANDIKAMEHRGYQFEGADASLELFVLKKLGRYKPFFELINYTILCEHPGMHNIADRATIKIAVNGVAEITAAEGNGPVNAIDLALRKALERFYPQLRDMHLIDYKVRVLDSTDATASVVRVLIDSGDQSGTWSTVGVSEDIIQASWMALVDSIEYKLYKG